MQWFFRSFPFQLLFCLGSGLLLLGLASLHGEARSRRAPVPLVKYTGEDQRSDDGPPRKRHVFMKRIHPANRALLRP